MQTRYRDAPIVRAWVYSIDNGPWTPARATWKDLEPELEAKEGVVIRVARPLIDDRLSPFATYNRVSGRWSPGCLLTAKESAGWLYPGALR